MKNSKFKSAYKTFVGRVPTLIHFFAPTNPRAEIGNIAGTCNRLTNDGYDYLARSILNRGVKFKHKRHGCVIAYKDANDDVMIGFSCVHPIDVGANNGKVDRYLGFFEAVNNSYPIPNNPHKLDHLLEFVPHSIRREVESMVYRARAYFKTGWYEGFEGFDGSADYESVSVGDFLD